MTPKELTKQLRPLLKGRRVRIANLKQDGWHGRCTDVVILPPDKRRWEDHAVAILAEDPDGYVGSPMLPLAIPQDRIVEVFEHTTKYGSTVYLKTVDGTLRGILIEEEECQW